MSKTLQLVLGIALLSPFAASARKLASETHKEPIATESKEVAKTYGPSTHEIMASGTLGALLISGDANLIFLNTGYAYNLPATKLQLEGSATWAHFSYNSLSSDGLLLFVGPTFNFANAHETTTTLTNDFFVGAKMGLAYGSVSVGSASDSTTKLAFDAQVGKRFELRDRLIYRPSFRVIKIMGSDFMFLVVPLELSFFW
ncbi:MAG: hypothetical protein JST16_13745 [Bdellovibrionales bacterium]|nr:hypothetical protein [Bdellovibrionales bacterium]